QVAEIRLQVIGYEMFKNTVALQRPAHGVDARQGDEIAQQPGNRIHCFVPGRCRHRISTTRNGGTGNIRGEQKRMECRSPVKRLTAPPRAWPSANSLQRPWRDPASPTEAA